MKLKPTQIAAGIAAGAMIGGGGYAIAATSSSVIHGCVNKKTHALTVSARCGKGTTALSWNKQGRTGGTGNTGKTGKTGGVGTSATVSVGSVSTGAPGSQATVTNVGTANDAKLNFSIPQGTAGTNGINTGPTSYGEIWVDSSSAEVAPGTSHNIVGAGSGGIDGGDVDIQGCSSAGLAEPVVSVTANHDPNDTLGGNTAAVSNAYVSGWSTEPGTSILVVDVDTTAAVNGTADLSDFSITVSC
jgi:hypothetical protein